MNAHFIAVFLFIKWNSSPLGTNGLLTHTTMWMNRNIILLVHFHTILEYAKESIKANLLVCRGSWERWAGRMMEYTRKLWEDHYPNCNGGFVGMHIYQAY